MDLTQQKLLAVAKKRLAAIEVTQCLDASNPSSRPSPIQDEILKNVTTPLVLIQAGNQCLAEGTLVMTTRGTKRIENIQAGEWVYDERGSPIRVKATYANGMKEVVTVHVEGGGVIRATLDHVFDTARGLSPVRDFTEGTYVRKCLRWENSTRLYRVEVCLDPVTVHTYDIHVDSPTNLYLLEGGFITHNSGKTSLMVRNLAWRFTETHPYWQRNTMKKCPSCGSEHVEVVNQSIRSVRCMECNNLWAGWEGEQLIFLALCMNSNHIQDIWENRLKPLLPPGTYSTKHDSGSLKYCTHLPTGNRIYWFSHDNPGECKKRVQYFSSHFAWIDELPADPSLIEELMRRCDAKRAQTFLTFTPKVPSPAARDFIDNANPLISTRYRISKFANPIYAGREVEEMAKISQLPITMQNAILYGDWVYSDNKRLSLDMANSVGTLPSHYSTDWQHVEAIDPAAAGKVGYALFAKDPTDCDSWWIVKALHLKGAAPSTLFDTVLPSVNSGYNIVKRVADPHETWFIKEAVVRKLAYESPFDKSHRRKELLGKLEEALISPTFKISDVGCKQLIDELNSAEEDPAKPGDIKKATNFHCIDAVIYGLDCLPKFTRPPAPLTIDQQRYQAWLDQEKKSVPKLKRQESNSWALRNQWRRR